MVIGGIPVDFAVVRPTVEVIQEDRHAVLVAEICDDESRYSAPSHDIVESVRMNAVSHTAANTKFSLATQVNILRIATESTSWIPISSPWLAAFSKLLARRTS